MEGWAFKGACDMNLVGLNRGKYSSVLKIICPWPSVKKLMLSYMFYQSLLHCLNLLAVYKWLNVSLGELMSLSKSNGISQNLNNNGNNGWGMGMRLLSEWGEVQRQKKMQEVIVFSVRRCKEFQAIEGIHLDIKVTTAVSLNNLIIKVICSEIFKAFSNCTSDACFSTSYTISVT